MPSERSRGPAVRKSSRAAARQLALALAAGATTTFLARHLSYDTPTSVDRRVRRWLRSHDADIARRLLWPLFPLGLPGGYFTIAFATARMLQRRGRPGGPAIMTSGSLGWLLHRGAKLLYRRERPRRPDKRIRSDSYPSGHTTGVTALAVTTAYVLRREGVVSPAAAIAIGVVAPAIMGAYRVIADDHWATDVIGGWTLGAAVGLACNATLVAADRPTRILRERGAKPRSAPRRVRSGPPPFEA